MTLATSSSRRKITLPERLIPVTSVPDMLPDTGNRVTSVTARNWVKSGVRGIKLASTRIGGRIYTSREAVDTFLERLQK